MTEFFNYDTLIWPEVAALPRDTPLVLPLGQGYALPGLASALRDPPRAGILPAVPFGWRGSGLAVPEALLAAMLNNLLNSLREDGFSQVWALLPQGFDPQYLAAPLANNWLALPRPAPSLAAAPLPSDDGRELVILLPIGHTEQHALHLPLNVDTVIIEAIAQGTQVATPECALTLPVMPYGVSTHRQAFAGTLNVGGRAFEDFWSAVVDSLVGRGFTRFYFMSGHGGNMSFLVNVVKYAGERHRRIFCATSFLHTSGRIGAAALEQYRSSARGGMGHAGELETSFMLYLRPELCRMQHVVDETDFVSTPAYFMDWIESGELIANPPWEDDTRTGAYGAGSLASAEKGRLWLAAAVAEKAAHVVEIHEQHSRREARRQAGFGRWGTG